MIVTSSEHSITEKIFRLDSLEMYELYVEKWYNIYTGYVLTDVKVLSCNTNSSVTMPSNWDLA